MIRPGPGPNSVLTMTARLFCPSKALASYQRIVLLGNSDDPATRPIYEKALASSIRILVDMGHWQEAIENADQYLLKFPSGDSIVDVRKWRANAAMSASREAAEAGG